ncbi:patatin-like phospholipase family protein [Lichenihabitans sp. PAMC28606]|uniref:patatin-like phospholipase family protein n=1 Tax=Lichenihabitans sp. PAMC28606 TaxID=2880932 RepID=UPI001D0B6207|nr:patatin-like phospholipase family protein [Lichenihabitans sp. PAMC28606]UDL94822.1 patatin-like phospholipase family protein [Lichenihabitans sp. PAMC28606]
MRNDETRSVAPAFVRPPCGVAVALGGGGARGLAHIVVLEALDDLGVRPLVLAGASMGAVVAAAYAAGMTARDIRAFSLRVLRNRRLLLGRMLEARVGRFTDILKRGLVNPVLLDAELLLPSFWPDDIPANFEDLLLPLLVVTTDFNARAQLVLQSGDLRSAVAGSMAIPGMVKPVERDGRVLVDGGVVNPLPYEMLFDQASVVLACDVSPGRADGQGIAPQPFEAMLGATQIMQAALTARMLRERPPHLVVHPPVERFRLLDFFYAARILEAADPCKDAIKRDLAALLETVL